MSNCYFDAYCFYQSPFGLIKICETGGFLTRAEFLVKSPESKYSQSKSIQNSNSLLKDACRQLGEYFDELRLSKEWAGEAYAELKKRLAEQKVAGGIEN